MFHLFRTLVGAIPLIESMEGSGGRPFLLPQVELQSSASISFEELSEIDDLEGFLREVPRMLLAGLEHSVVETLAEKRRRAAWQHVVLCSHSSLWCSVQLRPGGEEDESPSLVFSAFVPLAIALTPAPPRAATGGMVLVASSEVFPFMFQDLELGARDPEEFFSGDGLRELGDLIAGCFFVGLPPSPRGVGGETSPVRVEAQPFPG